MYIFGVDLGQAHDYTAVAIVEFIQPSTARTLTSNKRWKLEPAHFHCRYIERYSLGTPYPTIVKDIRDLMRRKPIYNDTKLVVDQTGVGKPVVEMMSQDDLSPIGITITNGNTINSDRHGGYMVPKRDLVSILQVLLQTERLKFAKEMPNVDKLVNEMLNFQVKISVSGNDTYEAWREGSHDDMVLALALACWYGEEYCYRVDSQSTRYHLPKHI